MKLRSLGLFLALIVTVYTPQLAYSMNPIINLFHVCSDKISFSESCRQVEKILERSQKKRNYHLNDTEAQHVQVFIDAFMKGLMKTDLNTMKRVWDASQLLSKHFFDKKINENPELLRNIINNLRNGRPKPPWEKEFHFFYFQRILELCRNNCEQVKLIFKKELDFLYFDLISSPNDVDLAVRATRLLLSEMEMGYVEGPLLAVRFMSNSVVYMRDQSGYNLFQEYIFGIGEHLTAIEIERLTLLYLRSQLENIAFEIGGGGLRALYKTDDIKARVMDSINMVDFLRMITINLHFVTYDQLNQYEKHLEMLCDDRMDYRAFDSVPPDQVFPHTTHLSRVDWSHQRDHLLEHPYPMIIKSFFPPDFYPLAMRMDKTDRW